MVIFHSYGTVYQRVIDLEFAGRFFGLMTCRSEVRQQHAESEVIPGSYMCYLLLSAQPIFLNPTVRRCQAKRVLFPSPSRLHLPASRTKTFQIYDQCIPKVSQSEKNCLLMELSHQLNQRNSKKPMAISIPTTAISCHQHLMNESNCAPHQTHKI